MSKQKNHTEVCEESKQSETMEGVVLTGHGGLEKLQYRSDLPRPKPGKRDVLIRVLAAAVNNTDVNTRVCWYSKSDKQEDASWTGHTLPLPLIQGADVCGRIVAVGADISSTRVGERVLVEPCFREVKGKEVNPPWYFGSECNGGFAQFCVVAARHAHTIKSSLTDVELASFPCSYSTAENLLSRANVRNGEHVLITGASGGVGSAVLQLAKARGARITALSSPAKFGALKALGADKLLSRDANLVQNLGANSVDVVVDVVAGALWNELLNVLRPGGRLAVAGAIGGAVVSQDVRTVYLKDLTIHGCTVLGVDVFARLVKRIERGEVKPVVHRTFPLKEIREAQTLFLAKKHVGKIVLVV